MAKPNPSLAMAGDPVLFIDDEPVRGLFKSAVRSARHDTIDATDGFGRMPHSARALGPFVRTVPV